MSRYGGEVASARSWKDRGVMNSWYWLLVLVLVTGKGDRGIPKKKKKLPAAGTDGLVKRDILKASR